MPFIYDYDPYHHQQEARKRRADRLLNELTIFAETHCTIQRYRGLPVSNNTLMLAMSKAFGLNDLAIVEEFCRRFVDDWTRAEEARTHASTEGGAG